MTTKRLAELDERDHQLEQRMAELRDELAAVQRETVSTAQLLRAVALFDPVWVLLLVPERFRILHLLIESRSLALEHGQVRERGRRIRLSTCDGSPPACAVPFRTK